MTIAGFQTLSLLDYPGVISAIVFTQGCPFRCPYCHNPELIPRMSAHPMLSEAAILAKLRQHRKMIEGVCITGGEPTIHPDLPEFLRRLKQERFRVKLDTNGINPMMVQRLMDEHLVDYVAMDLKHVWWKYDDVAKTGGARTMENCRRTFELIQQSTIPHEFRTTICPGVHVEEDFFDMVGYLKNGETYFIQETQFKKTLAEDLPQNSSLRADDLAASLQAAFPRLHIQSR